jgi:hypothetical protein
MTRANVRFPSQRCMQIPSSTEQGIFLLEQGIC